MSTQRFTARLVTPDGAASTQTIEAENRRDALRKAATAGTVISLSEGAGAQRSAPHADKHHPILILKQLAVLLRSGVNPLEALDTLAGSLPGSAAAEALHAFSGALRRGERFAAALEAALPAYPHYVYALARSGEAAGRLPQVLEEAARQMAAERRVSEDIRNALVYPLFLVVSGLLSIGFLLYAVVPRFNLMLTSGAANVDPFTRFVLELGVAFHDNVAWILAALVAAALAVVGLMRSSGFRAVLTDVAHTIPGLRDVLAARARMAWARIIALALSAGVDVLEALTLGASALPEGKRRAAGLSAVPALRAGRPIDAALRSAALLSDIDASLVRAGQRSGALAEMFHAVADRNEESLRDSLKQFTLIIEPVAIATVAILIGAIVLGLVSALTGIYEAVGATP